MYKKEDEREMVDVAKAVCVEKWDNDTARETEVFFDFPSEYATELAEGEYKKDYESVMDDFQSSPVEEIVPHFELRMSCPYGETVEDFGCVSLGIGYSDGSTTEVLDLFDLIPGVDFSVEDAKKIWEDAFGVGKKEPEI